MSKYFGIGLGRRCKQEIWIIQNSVLVLNRPLKITYTASENISYSVDLLWCKHMYEVGKYRKGWKKGKYLSRMAELVILWCMNETNNYPNDSLWDSTWKVISSSLYFLPLNSPFLFCGRSGWAETEVIIFCFIILCCVVLPCIVLYCILSFELLFCLHKSNEMALVELINSVNKTI